jgi:hypothetical protein
MTRYEDLGSEIGRLVDEKNAAYGNSFNESCEILRVLYPDGIRPDQYTDVLSIARIVDKLFRIANHKDAFGESPYCDIAGYGLLGTHRQEKEAYPDEDVDVEPEPKYDILKVEDKVGPYDPDEEYWQTGTLRRCMDCGVGLSPSEHYICNPCIDEEVDSFDDILQPGDLDW